MVTNDATILHIKHNVLYEVAKMAWMTELLNPGADNRTPQCMQDKHFMRKHWPNAYYGQK